MTELVLAIDIGGTKMAAAVVDASGAIHADGETPTQAATGELLLDVLTGLCQRVLDQAQLSPRDLLGIGVGCGGPMQYPEGLVSPLNIPVWRGFPLRDRLRQHFGLETIVDNDAKAYALGEYWIGGGRGARALLGIVVSTGVGGGVVLDGRLLHGAHGNAGHIGHMVVSVAGPRCACGARGCLEAIASGPSLVRRAHRLSRRAGRELEPSLTAADLERLARTGDVLAQRLFTDAGTALGRAIAGAASVIDLDRVVIGGGVSRAGDLLMPALQREMERTARLDFTRDLDVRLSELRVSASLAGAAALVHVPPAGPTHDSERS